MLELRVSDVVEHLVLQALLRRESEVRIEFQHPLKELNQFLSCVLVSVSESSLASMFLNLLGIVHNVLVFNERIIFIVLLSNQLKNFEKLVLVTDCCHALPLIVSWRERVATLPRKQQIIEDDVRRVLLRGLRLPSIEELSKNATDRPDVCLLTVAVFA